MKNNTKCDIAIDFSKSVFYKIDQLSIYIQTLAKNFFEIRRVDLTSDEFAALNFILNNPNICQRDLAKLTLRDRVRTGRILNSLEEKGYIERVNDTKNNRLVRRLTITKSGKKLYNEQFSIMSQIMDKVLEKFPEEKMIELRDTLTQLETALSEVVEFNI
ncbi:MarR family transcriptional regulator [bacterium]|nr:MarR family transcriptional regulator [bacterium]